MANWSAVGYALTAAGRRLQAKVEAGTVLELTRMKLGSGTETGEEVDARIDLVSPEVDVPISSAVVEGETCTVTGTLLISGLPHGFWAREWGLFALDPDEGEILYMIALDSEPDWIPANAEAGTSITYAMKVAVANATEIKANVDLTGLVEVEQLETSIHALRRRTIYQARDIVTAPNLPHGLLLECTAGGRTGETLIDLSGASCGDTVQDGGTAWQVKRIVATSVDDESHTVEWLRNVVNVFKVFCQDVKDKIPPTLPIRSAPREAVALPVSMGMIPAGGKSVWIATDAGEAANVQAEYVLEDGRKLTGMGTVIAGSDSRYVGGEKAGTATEDAACIVFDGAVEQAGLHPTYTLEDGTVIQDARATITGNGGTFYVGGPAAGIDWDKIIDGGILPPGSGTISHEDIDHMFN